MTPKERKKQISSQVSQGIEISLFSISTKSYPSQRKLTLSVTVKIVFRKKMKTQDIHAEIKINLCYRL